MSNSRPSWLGGLCLEKNNNSVPLKGHLSSSPRLDAILQGLLLFGPVVWIVVGTPIRVSRLRKADLVILPNRRGYLKAVRISQENQDSP